MSLSLAILYDCPHARLHSNHSEHFLLFVDKCSDKDANVDLSAACDAEQKYRCKADHGRVNGEGRCLPNCQPGDTGNCFCPLGQEVNSNTGCRGKK